MPTASSYGKNCAARPARLMCNFEMTPPQVSQCMPPTQEYNEHAAQPVRKAKRSAAVLAFGGNVKFALRRLSSLGVSRFVVRFSLGRCFAVLSSVLVPGVGWACVVPSRPPVLVVGRRRAPWPPCVFSVVFGGCRRCPLWRSVCFGVDSLLLPPFVPGLSRVSSRGLPPSLPGWRSAVESARSAGVRACLLSFSLPCARVFASAFGSGVFPLPVPVFVVPSADCRRWVAVPARRG